MQERFLKIRWSTTRRKMFSLRVGGVLVLPRSEYFNAYASTYRLNDAFAGQRVWEQQRKGGSVTVRRIA